MLIKDVQNCAEFIASDNTSLRELLHPAKMDVTVRYSLAHAIVKPGQTSRPHKLKTAEVYYILEGEGVMCIAKEQAKVHQGQVIYIPPQATQSISNSGNSDLKFLCIVDPAWRVEDEVV